MLPLSHLSGVRLHVYLLRPNKYLAKSAEELDIKTYVQQHDQPAAYYGQREEHQRNDMYADNTYNAPDNHEQERHDNNVDTNRLKICPTVNCQICQQSLLSNNALHRHF